MVPSQVLAVYRNTTAVWDDVSFADGETLHATPHHPFWVESKQAWVGADKLEAGMTVLLENGQQEKVLSSTLHHLSNPETTYNFNVENQHDYFVGKDQVLAHNTCQATGSYTITFASGKKYHGKGSQSRMEQSAKEKSLEHDDPVANKDWTPSKNDREGFKDEAKRLAGDGGLRVQQTII